MNIKANKLTKRSSKRQPTLRSSNYFMTISSNRPIIDLSVEQKNALLTKFSHTVKQFFDGKIKDFIQLSPSTEETEAIKSVPLENRFVGDIPIDYSFEIGPKKHIPHSHGTMQMKHRALNVKLDYKGIYDWLEEQMGYRIHFDAVVYRDNQMTLEQYISKKSESF